MDRKTDTREKAYLKNRMREIEIRCKRATPGPWDAYFETGIAPFLVTFNELPGGMRSIKDTVPMSLQNLEFAAAARTDVPYLITEIRKLLARDVERNTHTSRERKLLIKIPRILEEHKIFKKIVKRIMYRGPDSRDPVGFLEMLQNRAREALRGNNA